MEVVTPVELKSDVIVPDAQEPADEYNVKEECIIIEQQAVPEVAAPPEVEPADVIGNAGIEQMDVEETGEEEAEEERTEDERTEDEEEEAEVAVVTKVTSPTLRKMKKKRGSRSSKNGQTYSAMVKEAIEKLTCDSRKGASCPAIKKYLQEQFNLTINQSRTNTLINKTLKDGLEKGLFVKVKGRGLSGSFKVAVDRTEKEQEQKKKKEKRQKETEREKRFVNREYTRLRHMEESTRLKHVMKVRIARRKQHQRLLETGASPLGSDLVDRVQSILEQN